MYLITPIYLVILYIYNIVTRNMFELYATVFPAWFLFYILGLDCRKGKIENDKIRIWWIVPAIGLSFFETYMLIKTGNSLNFACSQIKFSSFIYAICICLLCVKCERKCDKNILSVVGDCSFGIYFSHILVLDCIEKIIITEIWFIKWILTFLLVLCFTFIIVWTIRKLVNEKKILRLIGFD